MVRRIITLISVERLQKRCLFQSISTILNPLMDRDFRNKFTELSVVAACKLPYGLTTDSFDRLLDMFALEMRYWWIEKKGFRS